MHFPDDFFDRMEPNIQRAFAAMDSLESGAIMNPDENRMVGHYWLRNHTLAPSPEIRQTIADTIRSITAFSASVHDGTIKPQKQVRFTRYLSIGIGGSALGPQFAADALGSPADRMKPYFLDNTDPDGIDRVLEEIGDHLSETLTIVISKSGGTVETRNGMLETMRAYEKAGLPFEKHAIAITGVGSKLHDQAIEDNWLSIFPMWDWVGGRTSITSAVGLLPMALQGVDIKSFIHGASLCDELTRNKTTRSNPSALLALMWYHATKGNGSKDMVILPYKDRLQLFARYLQQLIMESLGKEKDLSGNIVNQGIAVYGNKGATDQHAYVQQLREGVNNFFATFIEVLKDRETASVPVENSITTGDCLNAFLQGTRDALTEGGRESLSITIDHLDARSLGALIALYERAVGFYATLIDVNAYHQPGVEAGKKMAGAVLDLQRRLIAHLEKSAGTAFSVDELAAACSADPETIFHILEHASANKDHHIIRTGGARPFDSRYSLGR
jgi:glucose-6-phosphate isomerase